MILEVALLDVAEGWGGEFEAAFRRASSLLPSSPGYVSHELQRCPETRDRYVLLVRWESLEDHTEGFRRSEAYEEWRRLLHHFYDPFTTVKHFEMVHDASGGS